jgi:hypothetical protein
VVAADGDLFEANAGAGAGADAEAAGGAGGHREAPWSPGGADLAGAGVAVVGRRIRGVVAGDEFAADAAEEALAIPDLLAGLGEGAGASEAGGAAPIPAGCGAARGRGGRAVRVLLALGGGRRGNDLVGGPAGPEEEREEQAAGGGPQATGLRGRPPPRVSCMKIPGAPPGERR